MIGDLTSAPSPSSSSSFHRMPSFSEIRLRRVADCDRQNTDWQSSPGRGRAERHRKHHQRPGRSYQVNPAVAARAGFTPEEIALTPPLSWKASLRQTPVILNDRAYTIRVRFPEQRPYFARPYEQYADHQFRRAHGHARLVGHDHHGPRPDGDPARKPSACCSSHRSPRGSGFRSGIAAVQKAVNDLHLPSSIRVEYGGLYEEQQKSFSRSGDGVVSLRSCCCSSCCSSNSAPSRRPPPFLLRRCSPLWRGSSRSWSPARHLTSRLSWV